ncbi:MAG: hypothetical protein J6D01_02740 [Muribaculaceae bacterium]|jgi:hypothetical protein|nr:hypothetical protein [Muribaculaceae bacterium]
MRYIKAIIAAVVMSVCGSANGAGAAETPVMDGNSKVAFAWGVDVGSSIDLTTADMSSLNGDAYFGLKCPGMEIVGVGAGIHGMVNNNSFSYPVYVLMRTSFSKQRKLCFFDLRTGVALNSFFGTATDAAFYINPSVGINLAGSRKFQSYLTLGYSYNGGKDISDAETTSGKSAKNLSMATIRLGIMF